MKNLKCEMSLEGLKWLIGFKLSFVDHGSWLLFCIASHTVIALPTIATAIVVALLHSQRR